MLFAIMTTQYFSMSLGGPVDQGLLDALEATYKAVSCESWVTILHVWF